MSDSLTAWAAGLFEGEGSITISTDRRYNRQYPQLQMTMTDEDVVRRFAEVVQVGSVHGPLTKGYRTAKPFWRWRVCNKAGVQKVLGSFAPFLGKRRTARAQEILAMYCQVKDLCASKEREGK